MKKIITYIFAFLLVVLGVFYWFLKQTVNPQNDHIQISSLSGEATVVFDAYGIPHIYADNDEDAFKLLGYVQASDRLFQMELLRRVGGGNLSEILGSDLIATDQFIRTVGINDNALKAAEAFKSAPPEIQSKVNAFLQGVNAYLEKGKNPIEFTLLGIKKKPFTIEDIHRILGYMGFGFSMELKTEPIFDFVKNKYGAQYFNEMYTNLQETDTQIPTTSNFVNDFSVITEITQNAMKSFPLPIFYGSNAWVIGGKKTKNGKVLFANDTHIGFSQPSVWYEAHIETPSTHLYGNFLAGVPFPIIAHTRTHSWGLTIFPNDQIDLFQEEINGDLVKYKNQWEPIQTRKETVKIKGLPDTVFTVKTTPHGPIISDLKQTNDARTISMYWVANHSIDLKLQALHTLTYAQNLETVAAAAQLIHSPGLNIMYGDLAGNIAWYAAGSLIHRPDSINSFTVLNGANGKNDPLGIYPFSQNPKSVNPSGGFVYSANNSPGEVNGYTPPGYYYAGTRAQIIASQIEAKNDWDQEAMKNLVMDNTSPIYPQNAQVITHKIVGNSNLEKQVLELINKWNGDHHLKSVGPTIYYKLIYHVLHLTMADELGEERFEQYLSTSPYLHSIYPLLRNENSVWFDNIHTPQKESREEIFNAAFTRSVAELEKQLGADPTKWNWEKVHFIEHPHALGKVKPLNHIFNVGPMPSAGGEEVINKIAFTLNAVGVYKARSGPAMRILIDFNDIENSESINPTGQSGNFMSKHYSNQAANYNEGIFRGQLMNKDQIISQSTGKWVFTP